MKTITALLFLIVFIVSCKKETNNPDPVVASEINLITPGTASAGDVVTLSGKNFQSGSTVLFGNTPATVSSVTPTEIKATVPAGTGTVQVQVQSSSLKSNAVPFTYSTSANTTPSITTIQSVASITGDTLVVNGTNFNATSKLYFGTTEVPVLSFTPVKITAILPVGSGIVAVSVKNTDAGGQIIPSNQLNFTFGTVSSTTVLIGGVNYTIDTLSNYKIGPGSNYMALQFSNATTTKPIRVFLTTVDVTNQYMSFKPVIGRDSVSNNEKPSAMAARKSTSGNRYIAGTNSDFFNTTTGYPRNVNMIDGVLGSPSELVPITGSYYAGNAIFDAQKKMQIDALTYTASATIGTQSMNIDTINYYTMANANSLMFFNIYCGKTTGTNNNRTEVAITPVNGSINYLGETEMKVVALYPNKGNNAVDNSISILSGTGTGRTFLNQLKVNDVLKVKFSLASRSGFSVVPHNVTGGRQIIMKNGIVQPDFWNGDEKHPRTGIGYSHNGTKVYMCVVDGRSTIAADVLTSEMAQIMKYYGATDALNLDGGGSSAMFLDKIGIVNSPSDAAGERAVVAGIFAVSTAPDDDQIAEIVPKQYATRLAKGASFTPVFYGLNKYGQVVNTNVTGVTVFPNGLGNYSGGNFTAGNTNAYGFVTATYNNLSTRIKVIIE